MKKLLLLCFFLFPYLIGTSLCAQQSTISGIVSIHNSQTETGTRQFVHNATIKDSLNQAQQVLTSNNGGFDLVYVSVPNGTSVRIKVSIKGLEVVNIYELKAVLGQLSLMRISMATPQEIKKMSENMYNNGYTNASKKYKAEIKATKEKLSLLEQNDDENRQEIASLQDRLVKLENRSDRLEEQMKELTERYVQVNLDDALPLYKEAFNLFQEGKPEEALSRLGGPLEKMTDKYFIKENQNRSRKEETIQNDKELAEELPKLLTTWQFRADLFIYDTHLQIDSAEYCYERLFQLDSNSLVTLKNYGLFKSEILDYESAIKINKKLLSKNPAKQDSAAYLNDIGNCYKYLGIADSSYLYYRLAINTYYDLFKKTGDELFYYRWGSTFNNLGGVFSRVGDYTRAKRCYKTSISVYFSLKNVDNNILEELGYTLLNLGSILTAQDSIATALKYLSDAKDLFYDLAFRDTSNSDYTFQLANSFNFIAQAYRESDSTLLSFKNYMISDSIYNKIYEKNMLKYGFEYGRMLMGFSVLISKLEKEYRQKILIDTLAYSEYLMIKAISVFEKITKIYPRQFASEYSQILRNASDLFFQNEKYKKSLYYSEEGIRFINNLYIKTKQDSINLAIEYSKLSFLQYKINQKYHEALLLLKNAFMIFDSLATSNPKHRQEKISLYQQYTWLLILDHQFSKAEIYSREDIEFKPNDFYSQSNLAHSLLLQHKFKEAKLVYTHLFALDKELFPTLKSDIILFKKINIIDEDAFRYFNQNILRVD